MDLLSYLRRIAVGSQLGEASSAAGDDLLQPSHLLSQWLPTCRNRACPRRKPYLPGYLRRSRGLLVEDRWFCGPGCSEEYLLYRVRALLSQFRHSPPRAFRVPLGMILLSRGIIDRNDVREALRRQQLNPQTRFGECLMAENLVSEQQLAAALSQQWGCPFYPLEAQPVEFLPFSIAPLEIFRASSCVPVFLSADSRTLHVAFCYRVDHTTLFALESMLGCRTFPSVALSSSVLLALDTQSTAAPRQEPLFETVRDPRDVAAILSSYAAELRASSIRMVRTQRHLWARFSLKRSVRDVLFQLPDRRPAHVSHSHAKDCSDSADIRGDGVSTQPLPS